MIVPPDIVKEVTGYSTQAGQRRWLVDHGWKFEISRSGRPVVMQAEMERHMLGGASKPRDRQLKSLGG